jgi:glutamate dehydrogenase (NAD(P)+)
MMDEYETITREHQPGVITGKPIPIGGSQGRMDSTARGGIFTIREAGKALGIDMKNATIAVQGFGNVGKFACKLAPELLGMKLVAASDEFGAIYNSDGFDVEALMEHHAKTGSVKDFAGAKEISNGELLELEVDVLVPAAIEAVITADNAANVKAKIICELANGPTTMEADKILEEKGVFIIPDFLANAGGVTVSYFEQVQNAANFYWPLEEVQQRLDEKMTSAFNAVYDLSKKRKVRMRLAAYMISVIRVAEACKLRGWV